MERSLAKPRLQVTRLTSDPPSPGECASYTMQSVEHYIKMCVQIREANISSVWLRISFAGWQFRALVPHNKTSFCMYLRSAHTIFDVCNVLWMQYFCVMRYYM